MFLRVNEEFHPAKSGYLSSSCDSFEYKQINRNTSSKGLLYLLFTFDR